MLPKQLIQRIYDSFQAAPNGQASVRTISVINQPVFGQSKINTGGVAVQLPVAKLANGVILQAKTTNIANILLGGATVTQTEDGTGNGFILEPGASITFACEDTSDIYFNGAAGDILSYAGS